MGAGAGTPPKARSFAVQVGDLDLTFRETWQTQQRLSMEKLAKNLNREYGRVEVIASGTISSGIDGWNLPQKITDGFILVQTRRFLGCLWRQGKHPLLRMTGSRIASGDKPTTISCLLYQPKIEEIVVSVLDELGVYLRALPVLTLNRTVSPLDKRWEWLGFIR
jgi:hypothetical protein